MNTALKEKYPEATILLEVVINLFLGYLILGILRSGEPEKDNEIK